MLVRLELDHYYEKLNRASHGIPMRAHDPRGSTPCKWLSLACRVDRKEAQIGRVRQAGLHDGKGAPDHQWWRVVSVSDL
jgi:hypothetical protein